MFNLEIADLPAGHWAEAAVKESVQKGWLNLYNGNFHGNDTLSKYQVAMLLTNLFAELLPTRCDVICPETIHTGKYGRSSTVQILGDSEDLVQTVVKHYEKAPFFRVVNVSPMDISEDVQKGLFTVFLTLEHWDYISVMCVPFPKLADRLSISVISSTIFT